MGRLKKSYEFKEVFSKGRRVPGKRFILFVKENSYPYCRIGLVVGKKIGAAVERNRVKRLYRAALDKLLKGPNEPGESHKHYDFVFVGKRECVTAGMLDVYEELKGFVGRLKGLKR